MSAKNPIRSTVAVPHLSAGRGLVPQRYLVGWSDGIVKVGNTWNGRQRWGVFLARGATMLDLAHYEDLGDALNGETWLHEQLKKKYKKAFADRHEAVDRLGNSGAGYTDCFKIPTKDWPDIIKLARSE